MTSATNERQQSRLYRLSPIDATGLMFGLTFPQLILVSAGVVVGSTVMVTASVPIGVGILVLGASLGLVRIHGASIAELAPQGLRYARQRSGDGGAWFSAVPQLGGDLDDAPPALADQDILVVDPGPLGLGQPGAEIAVSRDRKAGTYAATIRVAGRQFALIDTANRTGWSRNGEQRSKRSSPREPRW